MAQMFVVVQFTVTSGAGSDPVSAVASRLPEVFGVSYLPRATSQGEAVFAVDCSSYRDAGLAAIKAFESAMAAVGAHGRLVQVRASEGPYALDPRDLNLSCAHCGPEHDDEVCLDCSTCADAALNRFLDDLLDGGGVDVYAEADRVHNLLGA